MYFPTFLLCFIVVVVLNKTSKLVFIQVLYLDSIDLGALSMEHNSFPRVRCFTYDRLRVMIAADTGFTAPAFTMVPTLTGLR